MEFNHLKTVQDQFQAYVLGQNRHIVNAVIGDQACSKEARLQIYQDAYFARLAEALGHDYPILAKQLGEANFAKMSQTYILHHPSVYRSIRWFGESLADFLKTLKDPLSPFWSELAKFEWALAAAFDAKDENPMTESALQNIPPEKWANLTFKFHPSFQLIDFSWNAPTIWKAIHKRHKVAPKSYQKSQTYLIWRQEQETYFVKLTVHEAWALEAACRKVPFAEMCEGLSPWVSQAQLILHSAGLLKSWIHKGLITRLEIN